MIIKRENYRLKSCLLRSMLNRNLKDIVQYSKGIKCVNIIDFEIWKVKGMKHKQTSAKRELKNSNVFFLKIVSFRFFFSFLFSPYLCV